MKIKKTFKTQVKQQDQSDCGVVCLKNILNYYNADVPLEQLREWSGTNRTGTTMLGLIQCAKKIGFDADGYEADINSLKDYNNIGILHIIKDNILQHFVIYYGYDSKNNLFIIGDPINTKPHFISEEKLLNLWKSKALILLKPTSDLPKKISENKFKWVVKSLKEDINILTMAALLGLTISILGLASAIFSQKFIDNLLPSNNFNTILKGCLLFAYLLLLNGSFTYIKQLFLIRQGKDYNIRIIKFFYSKLLKLPKSFFDSRKTGDLIARMNDTSRIQNTVTSFISSIIVNLLMIIVSSIAIFSYNWKIGLLSLLWFPTFLIIVLFFHPKILQSQTKLMQFYAQNESNYIDTIKGIETIKSFNKQNIFTALTLNIYTNYKVENYKLGKVGLQYQLVSQSIGSIFIVGLIIYGSYLTIYSDFTSGGVIAVLQLSTMLMGSVAGLAMLNIQLQEAKVALNRMFEYTSIDEEQLLEVENKKLDVNALELIDVSFGYPGRAKILNNINFSINKGECLGIVGEIGTGTSTLLQIIQQFYYPNSGTIKINNSENINEINITDWRNKLSVVSQQTHIFNGNIFYNIVLEEDYDQENIAAFCKSFGIDSFIDMLPQSYFTIVGEEGVNLSGGQRQIIAFARALYKKPQLLLLDEATASMDTKTEAFFIEILQKIKNEIIIIFVTHRIETLSKIADKTLQL
ncbi:MAG: peptidase domain-containing ABC transporter [Flavobacteriaceae bacterium]